MNWEVGTDIYALPCIKETASENLLESTGSSAWCSVMTYKLGITGWDGREAPEGGTYVCIWLIYSLFSRN